MRHILPALILLCAICSAQTTKTPAPKPPQGTTAAHTAKGAATLQGTVTDSSGAVLVDAKVTISNAAGVVASATSNAEGKFVVHDLAPGSYVVSVTAAKFKEFKTEGFAVLTGEENYLDTLLEPAGEITQVEVTGQTQTQIETEKSEVAGTISVRQIETLPPNGRNFSKFITLTPGVTDQTGQDEAKVGVVGSAKYSVNGGRVEYNTFDIDGTDVLNTGIAASRGHSTFIVYPSLDAIQEMKVLTSNYGAQYGRSASGTVLVNTRSGEQKFHGNAYEFLRNEIFNAHGFNDPQGKVPVYRRNDFGFTLGGPIFIPGLYNEKKDKTFFFFSEEMRLERSPYSFNQAVPSLNEREGNFSDVCPAPGIFDRAKYPDCPSPTTQLANQGSTKYPTFPGNIIPIDPNASAVLHTNLVPLANSKAGCNYRLNVDAVTDDPATWPCYNVTASPNTYWREELFRIDHNFSSTLKASFRYIHDSWDTTTLAPQWQYGGKFNSFPTVLNRFIGPGLSLVAHLTAIKSPSLVNDYSVGFTTDHIDLTSMAGPGATLTRPATLDATCGATLTSCGIGYLFPGNAGKIPAIFYGGSNAAYGGIGFTTDTSFMPWHHANPVVTIRDDLSKVLGKHTLQVGVLFVDSQQAELSSATGANTGNQQGLLTFSNVSNGSSTGNTFADSLTTVLGNTGGKMLYYQQDSAQHEYFTRYEIVEPYIQDDWRVTPRLMLNLGVRLSFFGNWTPNGSTVFNFVPSKYNFNLAQSLAVDPSYGYLKDAATGTAILADALHPDNRTVNGLVQCGTGGVPGSCMSSHLFNPAPRIGFAWDPKGKGETSIRGGYGIFFEHGTGDEANTGSLIGSAPLVLSMTQNSPPGNQIAWECIGGRGVGCSQTVPAGAAYPLDVMAIPTKAVWPYVQQWSLSLQQELTKNTVATLAYVGSKGTHLATVRQLNQFGAVPAKDNYFGLHEPIYYAASASDQGVCYVPNNGLPSYVVASGHRYFPGDPAYFNLEAACASNVNVNSFRKYPGYGRIMSIENVANSSYNALQMTVRHATKALNLGVSYTYGHSIDEASDRFESTLGNSLDPKSNRASSNFDQRHNLSVSYIYQLPLLWIPERLHSAVNCTETDVENENQDCASKPVVESYGGPSRLTQLLLGGWELSGITTYQTGQPFSIINGGSSLVSVLDNAGVANGLGAGSYPDVVRGVACYTAGASTIGSNSNGPLLSDPCIFVAPRGLTFGNAGRNFMRNPTRTNFDMSLTRRYSLPHERQLEFRMEAFNVFNHTQYRIYDAERGNTGSNTINCYGDITTGYSAGAPSCLAGSSFLRPVDAHRPRTLQFGLKLAF